MIGHSLAVDEQVGQVNAKLRAAFAPAESFDMLVPNRSGQIVDNFFKRFDVHCKFGIIIRKRLDCKPGNFCQCGKKRGEIVLRTV